MTIGESIRMARECKGISRQMLSIKSGVLDATISNWERDVATPTIALLICVADVLEVTLDELVGRDINKIQKKGNSRNASSM